MYFACIYNAAYISTRRYLAKGVILYLPGETWDEQVDEVEFLEGHELRCSASRLEKHGVVSVGGYLATVSGRTTCAPCKADWPSVASMWTSVARRLSAPVRPLTGCQRVDMCLHACGQLQYGLAN